MARRGVVWVPDWPVALAILSGQARADQAVAVYDARQIVAVNDVARAEGVSEGMRRRAAQRLVPELQLVPENPDSGAFEAVVAACEEHVAYISVLEPGMLTFLARGPVRSAGSETALAQKLIAQIVISVGVDAQVGFGDGLLESILSARAGMPVDVDRQPVRGLAAAFFSTQGKKNIGAFVEAMESLGVQHLGDVRALEKDAIVGRFGQLGVQVIALLEGRESYAGKAPAEGELAVSRQIDPPLQTVDQAAFLARELAEEMALALDHRAQTARYVSVKASTESGQHLEREWFLEDASAKDIAQRARWQLGAWIDAENKPESGLVRLELVAGDLLPAGARQGKLWGSDRASNASASRAVSRLQSMLGDESVLVPQQKGGRHPLEAHDFRLWGQSPGKPSDGPWPGSLPRPWPVKVGAGTEKVCLKAHCGHEVRLDALGMFYCEFGCADSFPLQLHRAGGYLTLTGYAGPWLQAGTWWGPKEQREIRQAWLEVTTEGGGFLLTVHDQQWWLAGEYQ